jgi:hypothetical protein
MRRMWSKMGQVPDVDLPSLDYTLSWTASNGSLRKRTGSPLVLAL